MTGTAEATKINLKGRDFLALEDFTPEEIKYLLALSHQVKKELAEGKDQKQYIGKNLLMLFELSSTRTRCAFETSASDLGLGCTYLSNSHFGVKETVKDSMRVFSSMYDVIAYRGATHAELLEMKKDTTIPLINAFTDHQHPTQMLADFMTLEELWGVEGYKGKTFLYLGKGGDCCAYSYAVMCAMLGMNFKYITSFMELDEALELLSPQELAKFREVVPEGQSPRAWCTGMAPNKRKIVEDLYAKYNPDCYYMETEDLNEVVGGDVITTENWGHFTDPAVAWLPSMRKYIPYQVNKELMEKTGNPDIVFLHMLPASHNCDHTAGEELVKGVDDPELKEFLKKGLEVTDEVFEMQADNVFREAENRKHTIKAVMNAIV